MENNYEKRDDYVMFANELKEGVDFEVTKRTENILGKKKEIYGIKLKNGDKYC